MSGPKYQPRRHMNAVIDASKSANTAWAILEAVGRLMEYDRPFVTFTKEQMMRETRRSLGSVKEGLAFLRSEGTLKPTRHFEGGRGRAVTYRICIAGQGDKIATEPPQGRGPEQVREDRFRYLSQKYGGLRAMEMMREDEG